MLYFSTTIISWILMEIAAKAIYSRLKSEGYDIIPKNKTKAEKVQEKSKILLIMCIPFVNILFSGIVTLSFDRIYKAFKQTLIAEGTVKKKEIHKEKIEIDLNSKEMNQTRKYSELSNEEKLKVLEEERASLLKEKETTARNESYNSIGAYTKRRDNK